MATTTLKAVQDDALISNDLYEKLEAYQDTYDKQLQAFIDAKVSDYEAMYPKEGYFIARIFLFDVKRADLPTNEKTLDQTTAEGLRAASKILIGKDTLAKDSSVLNHVVPLVKILKASENELGIENGQIWTVPPREVMGKRLNKEYAAIMQMQAHTAEGQKLPSTMPKELQEQISAISQNWGGNLLLRPWKVTPEATDFLTFILPKSKFICKWDFDQFYQTLVKEVSKTS